MAEYIEFENICDGVTTIPVDIGYVTIPLYGDIQCDIIEDWININISGQWSTWHFALPSFGQSYCFNNKEDTVKFVLKWL